MSDIKKNSAALLAALEQTDQKIQSATAEKLKIANQLAAVAPTLTAEERYQVLEKMASLLSVDEMTEKFTRLLSQNKVPLTNAASFQQLLVQATRRRQLFDFQPEWKLNNKRNAYKFIDSLGVKRPETYAFNQPLAKIEPRKGRY